MQAKLADEQASEPSLKGHAVHIATREAVSQKRRTAIDRLRLLWESRRFLKRTVSAGLLASAGLAFLLPTRYQSVTRLMPPDAQSSSALTMAALASRTGNAGLGDVAGDLLGLKSSGALFVGVLRSQTVEDRLVEHFHLQKVYGVPLAEDARHKLEENTSIAEDRLSGIISIAVTDRDSKRAASMAQAYAEELDRLVAQLSTSAAHRERVFLEERLQTVKQELDQAAQELSDFESRNAAIDIKEQGKAMVDAAATLMGQLIAAKAELKGLEPIYASNSVKVQSVQARISELNWELAKMGQKSEVGSDGAGDAFYPSIRKLPLLGETYADLYRRTKIKEVVYETLTQQYELAKVQEAKETPRVKVLDVATPPQRKSFPPRTLIIAMGCLVSLLGGSLLILVESQWQELNDQDAGKILAREVFQTMNSRMPWATPNGSRFQALTHKWWVRASRRGQLIGMGEQCSRDRELVEGEQK